MALVTQVGHKQWKILKICEMWVGDWMQPVKLEEQTQKENIWMEKSVWITSNQQP